MVMINEQKSPSDRLNETFTMGSNQGKTNNDREIAEILSMSD